MERSGLSSSRWLDAVWNPSAQIYTLPNGLNMLDVTGDGDAKLIVADLGNTTLTNAKIRVFKGIDEITQQTIPDIPSSILGFYTENNESKSAALAIGAGSHVFIFKNMRPHFKFCLPQINAHHREQDMWYKANLEEKLNVLTLVDDLQMLLQDIGAEILSPRTLKFLSLHGDVRQMFAEQYRNLPVIKKNTILIMGAIRKDSWAEIACTYLIIGTEFGEVLIMDHRAFFVVDKHVLGWPPVALAASGLWAGDGQIVFVGRDGKIGCIKRGCKFRYWETLTSPPVALATLACERTAVITMNGSLWAFSNMGIKLWKTDLPGNPLDMANLPVPQSGLSLLAISVAGLGIRIYDQKYNVDTIKMSESVSSVKYGRLGQEERAIAMVTCGGGLSVKILKRTADFSVRPDQHSNLGLTNTQSKFTIPKKTKLFIEQTIRERSEAARLHSTFQQGFLRLRLKVAYQACEIITIEKLAVSIPMTIQSALLGFGPSHIVRIVMTCFAEGFSNKNLYLVCRGKNVTVKPRLAIMPLLTTEIPYLITFLVTMNTRVISKIQILLCSKDQVKPLFTLNVPLPIPEEDIEV